MKKVLYSIYDRKARGPVNGVFQLLNNDEDAIRFFSDVVLSPNSGLINKHPEDFHLFSYGDFDEDSGMISIYPTGPIPVVSGDACVRAFERARAEYAAAQEAAKAAGIL